MNNNETSIIIGGFGGQGVVSAGTILALAAMSQDKYVTQMVSYGAEMRGGTANSTVVISSSPITSPVIERPDVAVLLNQPSLDKFEDRIVSGGLVVVNTSMVAREVKRDDLDVVKVDATNTANRLGNIRVANIIALGAFVARTGLVKMESLEGAIEELFGQKKSELVEINKKALAEGAK